MSRPSRANPSTGHRGSNAKVKPESQGEQEPDNRSPQAVFADEIRLAGQRETVEAFVVAFIFLLNIC